MRSREARHLVWYLPDCCSRVSLGIVESSVEWGSSQSLQHRQKIFEANFRWAAVGGEEYGLGSALQMPVGNLLQWGSYWVSLSQSMIAFPSPKYSVVPMTSSPRAYCLGCPLLWYFPNSYIISLPMEMSQSLYCASFDCMAALLNQPILNLSPGPWAGLFPK